MPFDGSPGVVGGTGRRSFLELYLPPAAVGKRSDAHFLSPNTRSTQSLSLSLFLSLMKTNNYINNKIVRKTLLTMGVTMEYGHPLTKLHG